MITTAFELPAVPFFLVEYTEFPPHRLSLNFSSYSKFECGWKLLKTGFFSGFSFKQTAARANEGALDSRRSFNERMQRWC